MEKATRIELERDEAVVVHASSRIFSAYVAGNQCDDKNEEAMLQKSIDLAVRLAKGVDIAVSAGNEVRAELQNDPNYRPLG